MQNKIYHSTQLMSTYSGMERVETLLERLKEQASGNGSIDDLLLTAQMLQSELMHIKSKADQDLQMDRVAINLPTLFDNPEIGRAHV